MNLQTILAITDFSVTTDAVLARAAQLAVEHGAALELMYVPPVGDLACPDATHRLSQYETKLGKRHEISVRTVDQPARCFQSIASAARRVDLVVMGATKEPSPMSFFLGSLEMQILRSAQRPVLVVHQNAGVDQSAYRRLLVAVDFSDASRKLVATTLALHKFAQLELFHAISPANQQKLRHAEASEQSIQAYMQSCGRHAQGRLIALTDSSDARRNRVGSVIGYGDPARQAVVQQQHSGADLVVVGKSPGGVVQDFVFGSVAQRLLRCATTDTMVIPKGFELATRALAVRRLSPPPLVTRRVRAGVPVEHCR